MSLNINTFMPFQKRSVNAVQIKSATKNLNLSDLQHFDLSHESYE